MEGSAAEGPGGLGMGGSSGRGEGGCCKGAAGWDGRLAGGGCRPVPGARAAPGAEETGGPKGSIHQLQGASEARAAKGESRLHQCRTESWLQGRFHRSRHPSGKTSAGCRAAHCLDWRRCRKAASMPARCSALPSKCQSHAKCRARTGGIARRAGCCSRRALEIPSAPADKPKKSCGESGRGFGGRPAGPENSENSEN